MSPRRSVAPDELAAFFRAQHPRLVGFLALYCGDAQVAEEIAQDALVRLCRDWNKVRRMDHPEAWLQRVGINLTNSYFRRRSAERRAKARLGDSKRSWVDRSDTELLDALSSIPARQKAALLLRHYIGLSTREAAETLGCPEGTIKTLVHKAIKNLRLSGAMTGEQERTDVG